MEFEQVLVKTGGFGLFQRTVMVLTLILSGLHTTLYSFGHFLILVTPFSQWCFLNDTLNSTIELSALPRGKCQSIGLASTEEGYQNETIFQQGLQTCPSGWQYDHREFFPTATTENQWVCGDSWKLYTVHTTFWLGSMAGYLVCGILSDRIGRKKTIVILIVIGASASLAGTYFSDLVGFSVLRFFTGMGALTVNSAVFVLVIEYTVSQRRTLIAFLWATTGCVVGCAAPWFGYLTQNWRAFLYAAVVADALLLLCVAWIPESSSWLLSVGRTPDAVRSLQRLASRNGKSITGEAVLELLLGKDKQSSPKILTFCESTKAMLKRPRILRITLLIYAAWFFISLCYNCCTLELGRLGLNIYTTYSVAMAFELPVYIICIVSVDVLGRRWPNVIFLLVGGVSSIAMGVARSNSGQWTLVMAALSISMFAGGYTVTYQLASEIFPTVIRGRAVQLQRLVGDLGGLAGMHVAALAERDRYLPVTAMGAMALAASAFAFFLPDTVHQALPQTLEDGEGLARDRGLFYCPVSARDLRMNRWGGHQSSHCSTRSNGRLSSRLGESSARKEDSAEKAVHWGASPENPQCLLEVCERDPPS
uniref:Putative synaptic vesicle transporter svop n=1 Tax=Amblyomma triste TaxID=251400 RepID=A0A023GNU7_AMBTT